MDISLVNAHLDLGAGRRGTDMGPSAIHVAGLIPKLRKLGHTVADIRSFDPVSHEATDVGDPAARFLDVILPLCTALADHVEQEVGRGRIPLVLGGDHSVAIGTIHGLARAMRPQEQRLGVLWVDAHADMNTPGSSPSGNIHGMPLAVLLGHGESSLCAIGKGAPALRAEDVAVIGARDIDPGEVALIRETGLRVYTMSEIDARGLNVCVQEAIERVSAHTAGIHLSFDLDGVDPRSAPGVGTPVPGGLGVRESHLICESVARTGMLAGLEMVELNPILDDGNRTGDLAVWLIESAFGKTIL